MHLKKSVEQFVNTVFDDSNNITSAVSELYSEKTLIHGPLGQQLGTKGVIHHWTQWVGAFSDNSADFELFESEDVLIGKWKVEGIHTEPFNGIPPTGKRITGEGISCYRFNSDGKVIVHDYQADLLAIYKQLGVGPSLIKLPQSTTANEDYEQLLEVLMKMGNDKPLITKRETTALALYLAGRSAKDIAGFFDISYRTVQTHIASAMHKVGCNSKSQLYDLVDSLGLTYIFRNFSDLLMNLSE